MSTLWVYDIACTEPKQPFRTYFCGPCTSFMIHYAFLNKQFLKFRGGGGWTTGEVRIDRRSLQRLWMRLLQWVLRLRRQLWLHLWRIPLSTTGRKLRGAPSARGLGLSWLIFKMFLHPQLLSRFCQNPICPSRIGQIVLPPRSKSTNPSPRPHGTPCISVFEVIWQLTRDISRIEGQFRARGKNLRSRWSQRAGTDPSRRRHRREVRWHLLLWALLYRLFLQFCW